jgi:capsular polysaccharide biosynthesis protein
VLYEGGVLTLDIDEAVRRLRANLFLILTCLVVGLGIPSAMHTDSSKTYRASTRLIMDVQDTKNTTAIADLARALITSEPAVEAALIKAKADRDPDNFGLKNVRLKGVGTSQVLELAVIDTDPVVAAAIANTLAQDLAARRSELTESRFTPLIDEINKRLVDATREVNRLEREFQNKGGTIPLERYRDAKDHRRDLESQRRTLMEEKSRQPKVQIVDPATAPKKARSSGLRADLLLGGFLGLFLGVGFAGIRETIHPTVVGGRSVSRLLETPFVGTLTAQPGSPKDPALIAVAARVRLAAEAAGVWTIALTSAGTNAGIHAFAEQLQAALDLDERGLHLISSAEPRAHLQVLTVEGEGLRALRDAPATVGLMLVSPTVIKRHDLDPVADLRSMTGWQLLGVVTYPWRAFGRRRRQRKFVAARPVLRTAGDIVPGDGFDGTLDLTDPDSSGERARGRWQ